MRRILAVIASLLLSVAAFAGVFPGPGPGAMVTSLKVDRAGHEFVYFSTAVATASCASEYKGMVVDATTPAGKEQVVLIQLAYVTGNTVKVTGAGSCSLVSGWETLDSIETVPTVPS